MGHGYFLASKSRARADILNGWTPIASCLTKISICHKMPKPKAKFHPVRKFFCKSCACAGLRRISRFSSCWNRVQFQGNQGVKLSQQKLPSHPPFDVLSGCATARANHFHVDMDAFFVSVEELTIHR